MKTARIFFAVFVIVYCCVVSAFGQSATKSFSLKITTPDAVVKVGSDVVITIIVTNISDQVLPVAKATGGLSGEMSGYRVEVVQANTNKPATPTRYQRILDRKRGADSTDTEVNSKGEAESLDTESVRFSLQTKFLTPKESLEDKIIINKLYTLTEPGTYLAEVQRTDEKNKTVVKSNRLKITLTE